MTRALSATGKLPVKVTAAVFLLGVSGIIAQTLVMRELLTLLSGYEFAVGLFLGCWIMAESAGAFAASRIKPSDAPEARFASATALFTLLLPLAIFSTRTCKHLAGMSPELGFTAPQTLIAASLLLGPMAFVHGYLFIEAARLTAKHTALPGSGAGYAYFWETIGTIAGGLLTAVLLTPRISPMNAAAAVAICNGLALYALTGRNRRFVPVFSAIAAIICGAGLTAGLGKYLHERSLAIQWPGSEIHSWRNTHYQNVTVLHRDSQFTLYADGVPLLPLPVPDVGGIEEFVHPPLLSHDQPRRILVLGGGAGGVISEILKHPGIEHIDYVELDPGMLEALLDIPVQTVRKELSDKRVRLHFRDGRRFVRTATEKYDMVFVGQQIPSNIQGNRFYSAEFFASVRRLLAPGGRMVISAPASPTYYGPDTAAINGIFRRTLESGFGTVATLQGDRNIYIGGSGTVLLPPSLLASRLRERGVGVRLITEGHLQYLSDTARTEWFNSQISASDRPINRDFQPVLLSASTGHNTAMHSPGMREWTRFAEKHSTGIVLSGLCILILLQILSMRRQESLYPVLIASTGFSAMLWELALITAFQILFGSMFLAIGSIIALFMAGMAAGSRIGNNAVDSGNPPDRLMVISEAAAVATALLLSASFLLLPHLSKYPFLSLILVAVLLFLCGMIPGIQFPLSVKLHRSGASADTGVGTVYAADLMGGWLGGMVGGMVLLPVLGTFKSCLMTVAVKGITLVFLYLRRKNR